MSNCTSEVRAYAHPGITIRLLLCGEKPVAPGLQPDDIAGSDLPIPGRIDLDHRPTCRQGNFGPLDRAECPDMPYRTLERTAAGRPDLHVMARNEQFRRPARPAVRPDIHRLATKPHAAVADIHRQHDRFADEAVDECGCRIVVDLAGRADLLAAA